MQDLTPRLWLKLLRLICYVVLAFLAAIFVGGLWQSIVKGNFDTALMWFYPLCIVITIALIVASLGGREAALVVQEQERFRVNPAFENLRIVPWFVAGFVVAIPFTFIFGSDKHIVTLVRQWFLVYGVGLYVARLLYRRWKNYEEGIPTGNNPIIDRTIVGSVIMFGGFMMCFATRGLIWRS